MMLSAVKETAVVLSVLMVVGGWWCPNELRMWRIGMATCALWKTPVTSASADDATTCRRVRHSTKMGLERGVVEDIVEPRVKCLATWLRAFGATR